MEGSVDAGAIVDELIAAVERRDIDAAVGLLAPDISYENMPVTPIVGREAVAAALGAFLGSADEVVWEIHRQLVDDHVVVNERLDRFRIGTGWIELPVAGVFEIGDDGLVRRWRDYFDLASYQRQHTELAGD